jgi:hypothetical protein
MKILYSLISRGMVLSNYALQRISDISAGCRDHVREPLHLSMISRLTRPGINGDGGLATWRNATAWQARGRTIGIIRYNAP